MNVDVLFTGDRITVIVAANRFTLGTVKMMVDGVAENFTASMLAPYLDEQDEHTCNHGIAFIEPEILNDAVRQLDAAGMQVHFHALGDCAVHNALDAVEATRAANGPSDGRHHLAHLQVVAAEDAPRSCNRGRARRRRHEHYRRRTV